MKEKGFTLIELLAVIVILAIIALIATPIILNIISDTKDSANERSKEMYLKAAEQAIARKNLTGNFNPTTCTVKSDGNLTCDTVELMVEINGQKPKEGGTITINDGKIISNTLEFGNPKKSGDTPALEEPEQPSEPIETITVYRWSVDIISIGDTTSPDEYTTDPTTLGKDFYLKHVINKDNKVIESYACAVYNNKETCVRGGSLDYYGYAENESEYTGNMLILKGLRDKGLSCDFYEDYSPCDDGSVTLDANRDGTVGASASDGSDYCIVFDDGISYCDF